VPASVSFKIPRYLEPRYGRIVEKLPSGVRGEKLLVGESCERGSFIIDAGSSIAFLLSRQGGGQTKRGETTAKPTGNSPKPWGSDNSHRGRRNTGHTNGKEFDAPIIMRGRGQREFSGDGQEL